MTAIWKTVRVFISSTFRDMHAERDHLVKVSFPRLRQWCGERRLHLIDIDLRWGVTKEEADNGRAIEVCLQEIDGSRPFFICILGNRYGWVPHDLPSEEHYLFRGLQEESGLSITHLEILHAALSPVPRKDQQRKDVCEQAFFYFRTPDCVPRAESLPDLSARQRQEHEATFFERNPLRRQMLEDLKSQISNRFHGQDRVWQYAGTWDATAENPEDDKLQGRLTDLDEFGLRVEADLQRGIAARFAQHIAALGQAADPLAEERAAHEAFIANRTQVYVPRPDVEAQLTRYADGDDRRPCMLSGPPGSGKSAILAHWVRERMKDEGGGMKDEPAGGLTANSGSSDARSSFIPHHSSLLIARFIGASPGSTSLARLLANVAQELQQRLVLTEEVEEEVETAPGQKEKRKQVQTMEVPLDPAEVVRKWPRFLEAAGQRVGRVSKPVPDGSGEPSYGRVIVVLDALNQLQRSADPSRRHWLPRQLPPGVRLIVSTLNHGERSKPTSYGRDSTGSASSGPSDWLAALRHLGLPEVPVPDFDEVARRQIIRQLPGVFCKTLGEADVTELLRNEATRNPLFLIVALEELRVFGSFEKLSERIRRLPFLRSPADAAGPVPSGTRVSPESDERAAKMSDAPSPVASDIEQTRDAMFGQDLDWLDREPARRVPDSIPTVFRLLASARKELKKLSDRIRRLPFLRSAWDAAGPVLSGAGVSPVSDERTGKMPVAPSSAVSDIEQALDAMFGQVLDRLDREAARTAPGLVPTVFRLLASAREGLSEQELRDLLARGLGHVPEARRNESLGIVLRQVRTYLMRKGPLVDFYHRSFWKAARAKYLPDDAACRAAHAELAVCFHDQEFFLESLEAQRQRATTLPYTPRRVNQRKIAELPWQRLQAHQWDEVESLLTELSFLEAKNEAGLVFELAADFTAAVAALPKDRPRRRVLRLLEEALRRDIHFIARHTQDYPQALFQCLWNSCWWYDCPEAAQHYVDGRPSVLPSPASGRGTAAEGDSSALGERLPTPPDPVPVGLSRPSDGAASTPTVHVFLERWRRTRERTLPGSFWLRALRPPPTLLGSGQELVLRGHEDAVYCVSFSPTGDRIVSGSGTVWDYTLRSWDARSGEQLAIFRGHWASVQSVAFSPDGNRIASGSHDGTVRVWDAHSGKELTVLRGHHEDHEDPVFSVAFSPDGEHIVSKGNRTVRVWDIGSGEQVGVLYWHGDSVTGATLSPGGDRLVAWVKDKAVGLVVWSDARQPFFRGQVFSIDGERIVGVGGVNLRVWDTCSGAHLAVLRGHKHPVEGVVFSPDEDRIVGWGRKAVQVWDARSGELLVDLCGHAKDVSNVACSADGKRIVSGSHDRTVRIWDLSTGAQLAELHGHELPVLGVAFSPGGERIVSASRDRTLRIWDADRGQQQPVLRGHNDDVTSIALSPSGDRIVSGSSDTTVRVWDAANGAELAVFRGYAHGVRSVAFSPDGERIVCGGETTLEPTMRIWDARSGAELAVIRAHEGSLWCVAFSPGGERIVSASQDKTVRIWDSYSGGQLAVLRGHRDAVQGVAFSRDGDKIVSGSSDGTVRVWGALSCEQLAVFHGHRGYVRSVAFSPESDRVVCVSGDDVLDRLGAWVWDAETSECLDVIQGAGDAPAIAAGSQGFPLRARTHGLETVVERADDGMQIAWFPVCVELIATFPSGCAWAGAFGNHVYIITLEGKEESVKGEG